MSRDGGPIFLYAGAMEFLKNHQADIILIAGFILIALISFNIGKIYHAEQKDRQIKIRDSAANMFRTENFEDSIPKLGHGVAIFNPQKHTNFKVVVSKKSKSGKYHYQWCSGAKRIREANQKWFNSAKEAEGAGYTLAKNCRQ